MTTNLDSAKTALQVAVSGLDQLAAALLATLAPGLRPGEAHLAGAPCRAPARASTLDEDLDELLLHIQRRRACR